MSALARTGARVRAGSALAYGHRAERLRAWVARARRDDLNGWQAALGSWLRLVALAVVGYATWRACRAWPWLMWALAGWWVAVAWRAGASQSTDKEVADEEAPPSGTAAAVPTAPGSLLPEAVRALARGGAGAHLAALAEHLSEETKQPWDTAAVRAACAAARIPVSDSVRQPGRGVSTGVRVDALPEPLPSPSPAHAVAVVVAGQNAPTPAATAPTTTAELQPTVVEREGLTIIRDPSDPRAYTA